MAVVTKKMFLMKYMYQGLIIYFISILGDVQLKDEEAQKHLSIYRDYTKKKEELLKENLESKLKKLNKKQSKNVQKMSAIPSSTHKNVEKEVDEPGSDDLDPRNHYRQLKINGVESKIAQMQLDENDLKDLVCKACLNANLHLMKSDGSPHCFSGREKLKGMFLRSFDLHRSR